MVWVFVILFEAFKLWCLYRLGRWWHRRQERERQLNMPPVKAPTFEPTDDFEQWVLAGNTGDDYTSAWTFWEWLDDVEESRKRSDEVLARAQAYEPADMDGECDPADDAAAVPPPDLGALLQNVSGTYVTLSHGGLGGQVVAIRPAGGGVPGQGLPAPIRTLLPGAWYFEPPF